MKKIVCILLALIAMCASAEELMEMELVDDTEVVRVEENVAYRESVEELKPMDEITPTATAEPIPQLRAREPEICTSKLPSGKYSATLGDTLLIPLTGLCDDIDISSTKYCTAAVTRKGISIQCTKAGTAKVVLQSRHNAKVKSTISIKVSKISKSLGTRSYTLKCGEELQLKYKDLGFSNTFPHYTYECSNKRLRFFSPRNGFINLTLGDSKRCTVKVKLFRYDDWGNAEYVTVKLKYTK